MTHHSRWFRSGLAGAALLCMLASGLATLMPSAAAIGIKPAGAATINTSFPGLEHTRYNGSFINETSLDIGVPSPDYQVDQLSMNFSNISPAKEAKTVVANGTLYKQIIKNIRKGLAVEINLSYPAIVYGVSLDINRSSIALPSPIYVQLRGFDPIHNYPNATIYAQVTLGAATVRGWQDHLFPSPVSLAAGRYFLAVNASIFSPSDNGFLNWWYSTEPTSLRVSEMDWAGAWVDGVLQDPFHYKIIRRVQVTEPEAMNMRVGLNGQEFPVTNGGPIATGTVTIGPQAGTVGSSTLQVFILNDIDSSLALDCNYTLELEHGIAMSTFLNASAGVPNSWLVLPSISRGTSECWFTMSIPGNWYAVSVLKDGLDITNETRVGNDILISNGTITAGATWVISARSPNVEFLVNAPSAQYHPGETFSMSATPPSITGNFTFIVLNTLGIEQGRTTIAHGPAATPFTFSIPSSEREGSSSVVVVWNNATDAGARSVAYTVTIPPPTDLITAVVIVAAAVSGGFIVAIALYTTVRRARRRLEAERLDVINKAKDLFNLNYIIVLDKRSGVDIYGQSFGDFTLDPTLVSGFLSAIGTFGLELTNTDEESQTIKLEYKKSKIVISEYKGFRITLIMKDAPSHGMVSALDRLAHDIDEKYGKALEGFNGETTEFQGIAGLIEKDIHVSFVAPLKVSPREKVDLTQDEKDVYNKATDVAMSKKMNPFYASEVLGGEEIDPKAVSAFFSLMVKGIITPAAKP
ncbi:MAG: hypothetical protein JW839_22075 [Candidatus Lokiarchaeota archaeon]|nr:hypothetical protein [Candidatus Lokiarchaeota archaeon]